MPQPTLSSALPPAGRSDRRLLAAALVLSLLIHISLYTTVSLGNFQTSQAELEPTIVDLVLEPPRDQRQIVSPPEKSDDIPPKDTNLLSDKDTQAKIETIHRGEDASPPPAKQETKTQPAVEKTAQPVKRPEAEPPKKPAEKTPQQLAKNIKQDSLFLGEKFASETSTQTVQPAEVKDPDKKTAGVNSEHKLRSDYQPFGSSLFIPGNSAGSPDLLPDVPDGEMTMLNAKAERFAVFVRRVAQQVFGQLRLSNWSQLSAGEVRQIGDFAKIHAIMSPEGNFVKLWIENSSGSTRFDKVVTNSIEKGLDDRNPPASARSDDGNYHFIFISRTWTRMLGERMKEQRWILLGTGLL